MSKQNNLPDILITEIQNQKVTVECRDVAYFEVLVRLGGKRINGTNEYCFSYKNDRELALILTSMRDHEIPFQGGSHGWPPSEIFFSLRDKSLTTGKIKIAANRGPKLGWYIREE